MDTRPKNSGAPFLVLAFALGLSFFLTCLPPWLLVSGFLAFLLLGWICALWNGHGKF